MIDEVSRDRLLDAHGVVDTSRARSIGESWSAHLEEHRDEITAIQLVQEAKDGRVSFADVAELADRFARPPRAWTPDLLWQAYEVVPSARICGQASDLGIRAAPGSCSR